MKHSLKALNTQQLTQVWSERVKACRSSNLPVTTWCKQNNIKVSTYYCWQKKLFDAATASVNTVEPTAISQPKTEFAEIPVKDIESIQEPSREVLAATIVVGKTSIDIYNTIQPELLQFLLKGVQSC